MFLLLGACASAPPPKPEPEPLVDRTADTSYDLSVVRDKLETAREFEEEFSRSLAAAVVETAQKMLAPGQTREREYLEVVKATIWAREGEGRDAEKANQLLGPIEQSASARGDYRLLGDVDLARIVLLLAQGDKVGAARTGDAALRNFTAALAHVRGVEAARDLAFQFLNAGDLAMARSFARRAHADAERIDDDELLIQTCMDVGRIGLFAGDDPEALFLQAYEAAYRLDSIGWRNVVIALASDAWYAQDNMQACIRWAQRLRDRDGYLPLPDEAGLYVADYITLLSQYFFALEATEKGSARGQEAARRALRAIESLTEGERADWAELEANLRAGLLQDEREK